MTLTAKRPRELAELYIPLSKGLCTDVGIEMTSLAVQIHGGMGYVEETGVAQHFRDARIAPIYEGTNGIQAADLVGRKLPMRAGGVVLDHLEEIDELAVRLRETDGFETFGDNLESAVAATRRASEWLLANGAVDPNHALAGSSPYLRMLGIAVCGGLMARFGLAAAEGLAAGSDEHDRDFYESKVVSARFFGEQILPAVDGLEATVTAGADDLFALTPEQLA